MVVSMDLALAIFDLNEGYSQNDLRKSYRRLVKKIKEQKTNEKNLLSFIEEAKELLENELIVKVPTIFTKTKRNISLSELYSLYYCLDNIQKVYELHSVQSYAKVTIYPIFRKKLQISFNIYFSSLFNDFKEFKRIDYLGILNIPKKFRKYKLFKVKVVFLNSTHKFLMSNHSVKKIIYKNPKFNTYLKIFLKNK